MVGQKELRHYSYGSIPYLNFKNGTHKKEGKKAKHFFSQSPWESLLKATKISSWESLLIATKILLISMYPVYF